MNGGAFDSGEACLHAPIETKVNASGFLAVRSGFISLITKSVIAILFAVCLSIPSHANESTPGLLANNLIRQFIQLTPRNAENLRDYAQSAVLPNINLEQMAIGLCGRSQWAAWNKQDQLSLTHALHDTLVRYILEAGDAYKDQRLDIEREESVSVNDRIIRLAIRDDYLPSISVDLFLQYRQGKWQAYDFSVAGISYVKMKRTQYKTLLALGGLPALLAHLNGKNQTYVNDNKISVL